MPMIQRSCPNCGTSVGARRYWLLNWWGVRWDCPACQRTLRFSTRRKVLITVLTVPVMAGYAYALTARDGWVALGAFLVGVAVSGLDTVELVGGKRGGR